MKTISTSEEVKKKLDLIALARELEEERHAREMKIIESGDLDALKIEVSKNFNY
jgi:hypothetical protein